MKAITPEISQEWAHSSIVKRKKQGELVYETNDNGRVYILEPVGNSKSQFRLIGVQE